MVSRSCFRENWEGWDSLERNQEMRALQHDLIINNRSRLDEDFGTPEEHLTAERLGVEHRDADSAQGGPHAQWR